MRAEPLFSIILATHGRGGLIKPTIESVLRQSFGDFELIVVGDGCIDDTGQAVASFASDKISWRSLAQNSGSQSAPNNEGLRHARGERIAYLGHDDIWAPDHLARLRDALAAGADFAVSGCIYYGPEGSEVYYVAGLFDASDAAFRDFFPPSSFAHRREVCERIGRWRHPRTLASPVDVNFVLRAAHAGLRFRSTGAITVHKFAAGHRYLSYLRPSADEQIAMLARLARGAANLERIVAGAQTMRLGDYSQVGPGVLADRNRASKGLSRPALRELSGRAVIAQTHEPRALDWYAVEHDGSRPFRWSGPNPRPKILIPFTGTAARIAICLRRPLAGEVSVRVEEQPVEHTIEAGPDGTCAIVVRASLRQSDYTVLTLQTPMSGGPERRGVAVGDIVLEPEP